MNYTGPSAKPHDSGVAVGIVIARNGKVFLMRRAGGSTGQGEWAIPGGAVEFMEDPKVAASRELLEETGVTATDFAFIGYTNDTHTTEKLHYVTFTLFTNSFVGEPKIMEPNKCTEIGWFDIDSLPSPLFKPSKHKLEVAEVKQKIRNSK